MDARTLPDLIVFLEVVRAGSLTRAAERLHTVQSNVTARIKSLERAVGTPLLRRHARGIRPTPAGEAALALAQRTGAILDDLRFAFGQNGKDAGRHGLAKLRVGAIETVAASHLPALLAGFSRQHRQVDVSVQTGSSLSLTAALERGELDVVFVSRAPNRPGFRAQVVFRDQLVVVAAASAKSLTALLGDPAAPAKVLVQRLGCSFTERLLGHAAARSWPRPQLLELGTLEGILAFVEMDMGVAAMPRAFVTALASHRRLRLFDLPARVSRLDTYLVAPPRADASLASNELLAFQTSSMPLLTKRG